MKRRNDSTLCESCDNRDSKTRSGTITDEILSDDEKHSTLTCTTDKISVNILFTPENIHEHIPFFDGAVFTQTEQMIFDFHQHKSKSKKKHARKYLAKLCILANRGFYLAWLNLPFKTVNQGRTNMCTAVATWYLYQVVGAACPGVHEVYLEMRQRQSSENGYLLSFVHDVFTSLIPGTRLQHVVLPLLNKDTYVRRLFCARCPFVFISQGHCELALDMNSQGEVLTLNSHGIKNSFAGYSLHKFGYLMTVVKDILLFPK